MRAKEAKKLGFNKLICSKLEKIRDELVYPIDNLKELKNYLG